MACRLCEGSSKVLILQISIFLNEPAARKKELERLGGIQISEFLENFYQNK